MNDVNSDGERGFRSFRGMMPILPTPVDKEQNVDEASLRRLVRYCRQCGAAAVGHFGFASEFFKLSDADRSRITEIVVDEAAGQLPVFIGVTAPSTRAALGYAREAEKLGADLLMAGVPYVQVPDGEGTFDYYRELGAATSLPIIIQDTPKSSAVITPELAVRMFNEIETIGYIKIEGEDFLAKSARVMEIAGNRMAVIGGYGGKHMLHMLRIGVKCFMTGTEILEVHSAIVGAFLGGSEEEAAELYYNKFLPYFTFYETYHEELLKEMLHLRGIIDCPDVIPPRAMKRMSDVERKEFLWVLDRIKGTEYNKTI